MADDNKDNFIFVTGNKKKDKKVLREFATTTESSKEKGKYKFPGNNNSDQVMSEIDAEETSVKDLPPSLKFEMYKHLFPKKKCYVLLDEDWRATWLAKFAAQFNFGIADANLSGCLSLYQSDFQTAFISLTTTATSPTQNTAPYFYYFDELNYRATLELSAFKTPGGGPVLKFALNLRLSNDGFLYPPSNQLTLKVGETVPNHNCDG